MQVANYIQSGLDKLQQLNILLPKVETAPVLPLLERIAHYDNAKVTQIALTLQNSTNFNAIIRQELQGMDISTRYADITKQFDDIREDAQTMAQWMSDGKLDIGEKVKYNWMKVRRGSIPDRFGKIRETYLSVSKDCSKQIERETAILDAYQDFRLALKVSEVAANDILKIASTHLESKKALLTAASKAIEDAKTANPTASYPELELARDEAIRALQAEDKSYQIVKDIADDLKTSYNTAELVFARLQQTHTVKERLYERSVMFFSTNEVVFTGLSASFTASAGLAEATNTLEAMKTGINKGIESMATIGGQDLDKAIKASYGSTLQTSSVQSLANAIVEFQEKSRDLITELRAESTRTASEIEAATDDAKVRFVKLLQKGA